MTSTARTAHGDEADEVPSLEHSLATILLYLVSICLTVISICLKSLLLSQYWEWFMVPLGLRMLGWRAMVGVVLIVPLLLSGLVGQIADIRIKVCGTRSIRERLIPDFVQGLLALGLLLVIGAVGHTLVTQ